MYSIAFAASFFILAFFLADSRALPPRADSREGELSIPPRRPLGVLLTLTRLAGPRPELERRGVARGVVRGVLIALEGVCFAVERGVAVVMRLGR